MEKLRKIFSAAVFAVFVISFITAGCAEQKDEETNNLQKPSLNADTVRQDTAANTSGGSIVRTGVIDLTSIDKNNDGKVYECPMDYNVISDTKNECPQCKMDLEEMSLEKVRENLKANNFQVR